MDSIDQRVTTDLQIVLDGFTCVLFGNSADYLARGPQRPSGISGLGRLEPLGHGHRRLRPTL